MRKENEKKRGKGMWKKEGNAKREVTHIYPFPQNLPLLPSVYFFLPLSVNLQPTLEFQIADRSACKNGRKYPREAR